MNALKKRIEELERIDSPGKYHLLASDQFCNTEAREMKRAEILNNKPLDRVVLIDIVDARKGPEYSMEAITLWAGDE